jgi:hypothetical protein
MIFESETDHAGGLFVSPVWAIGDLLATGGKFDSFVRSRELVKQEGVIFKHVLRMVLLCREMAQLNPPAASRRTDLPPWHERLRNIAAQLESSAREVDPQSTEELLEELADEA